MVRWTGKRILRLQLYQQVPKLFGGLVSWEHLPFLLLYAIVLQWCYTTMGEPHLKALAKAEAEGIALPQTVEALRAQASAFLLKAAAKDGKDDADAHPFASWFGGADSADKGPPIPEYHVPSRYLPGFWPLFFLGAVATLHALAMLLQVWLVDARCWVRYRRVESVHKATHVKVIPRAHRGKKELLPLEKGGLGTVFICLRRKYLYRPEDETFHKVRCKVDYPLGFFLRWRGFASDAEVADAQERYGKNLFEIRLPAFADLYKQQLVSPFTVFQLFCVILWCLDSYWQYSVFTLFMIFSFEASVVMQRIKNLNVLKGMDNRVLDVLVYRNRRWERTTTTELVPGDLFSLTRGKEPGQEIVPCDCLLLRGSAVVNEATLTGESIPQMKDAVHPSGGAVDEERLDIKSGTGKVHTLFGGTRLLQVSAGGGSNSVEVLDDEERVQEGEAPLAEARGEDSHGLGLSEEAVPPTPDGGCVCYALRTGFSSSQGKLVRMIEGSTESVRTDTRDTALLLLLLLVFAVAASGYVLKKGMEDGDKSKYQLLLHCVLIITSVIPPELPMQMALAVNSALITLMKMQIFCTEPFRVPVAGRVDVCLFDKTGTLTTDELVAVGVTDLQQSRGAGATGGSEAESLGLTGMPDAPPLATVVLGACHALVLVDGKVAGDPIEAAALRAIKWEVQEKQKSGFAQVTQCRPQPPQLALRGTSAFEVRGFGSAAQLEILTRHHFSSKLQRMSVVAQGASASRALVLAKGSPEAVAKLLKPSALPSKYHDAAAALAKEGMRVLALAYKAVSGEAAVAAVVGSRADAEAELEFAGFVAFTCRVRKDTASVIAQLVAGKHEVAMVTGDALLTAVHVAKQVGICRPYKRGIYILGIRGGDGGGGDQQQQQVVWESYETGREAVAFDAAAMPRVARDFDLCTTGTSLAVASRLHPGIRKHLEHFVVFARMTPDEKEGVITSLKDCGRVTLMCGDGANDVGALKQAHVGVALLSGFGDLNVDRGDASSSSGGKQGAGALDVAGSGGGGGGTAIMTRQQLEELQRLKPSEIKRKLRALGVAPEDHPQCVEKADLIRLYQAAAQRQAAKAHDQKNARDLATAAAKPRPGAGKVKTRAELEQERRELMLKQQEDLRKELEERQARGESFAMAKALMAMYQKQAAEGRKKREQMLKDSTLEASAAKMAAMLDEGEGEGGEVPMVKIGDASVAAPFTSKMPSIRGTVDIIRQGRCTLVTTIQMYQILALTCLISSYSLSVLHLDGVKYGDYQMTALGILMSVSFVTVSRSKPLERLSSVRPFGSVFHPALFLSILGQFALHLASMMLAVRESKKHLPPDYKPEPDGEFKANVINSVVFLVSAVQQVSVFVVNLKGPPFMSGLTENSPLLYSLAATFVLTFLLASETIPQLNKFLQLVPFPTPQFRSLVLSLLAADIGLSFFWDRLMTFLFAPRVLRASMEGVTRQDVFKMVKTFAVIGGIIWFLSQGDLSELELALQEGLEGGATEAAAAAAAAAGAGNAPLADAVLAPRPPVEDPGAGLEEFVAA